MRGVVRSTGHLRFTTRTYRVALGFGGVRFGKKEGDGATPAATLPLRKIFYRADRLAAPVSAVDVQKLKQTDGWCDDPAHAAYNQLVSLPLDARAETLWRDDCVYDIIGVLGWNDSPAIPGKGSAIFLHLARPDYSPTEGCVALSLDDLLEVLAKGLTEIQVTI